MNGEPLGYLVTVSSSDESTHPQQNITSRYLQNFNLAKNLVPSTLYVFEVCAYNSVGTGPCSRVLGRTQNSGQDFLELQILRNYSKRNRAEENLILIL